MQKLLVFLVCAVLFGGATPARALELTKTPSSEFLPTAPVLITGYQTAGAATTLRALEVYNASDVPVSLGDWAVSVVLQDGTSHDIGASTVYRTWLLPRSHVVYSTSPTTTYQLSDDTQPGAIASIQLRYTADANTSYKVASAIVKDTTDAAVFRTYTTTGYSTASQPFAATPIRAFYDDGLYSAPQTAGDVQIVEVYPYSSDCAPNDTSVLCSDYVKITNMGSSDISLDDYVLRTDSNSTSPTSSNTFTLAGKLAPGDFMVIHQTDTGQPMSLTNSGGYVWLEDAWGFARYDATLTKYAAATSSEQGLSYAVAADGTWAWSTTPEPLGANVITPPVVAIAECPAGKYRNPDTGRCRTIEETMNELSACDEGYERNPTTNRCRKIATVAATLTPCLEGQERNPVTNRCRSIASAVAELLPCDEGYERNPTTNRCRKVAATDMPAAAFPVTPVQPTAADTAGWVAFGVVTSLALGYGVWEWRVEIAMLGRRLLAIFTHSK